jgi:transposase
LVAANERIALTFALSPGQAHDAPEGRKLLTRWQRRRDGVPIVMDRAYEGDETRQLVLQLGFKPVVPPNPNRLYPWTYDRSLYRRRNEIARLFRRPKGFRRIFSRFEKLDTMFTAFIHFTLIIDMTCVNML